MRKTPIMTAIRPYTHDDRGAVERLNSTYYQEAHGFDATFGDAVSGALDAIDTAVDARTGAGWVVQEDDAIAGSLFLTPDGIGVGRIRLFFIRPVLHGHGLGGAMLEHCLREAAPLRFEILRVSTFSIHKAACALYLRSCFEQEQERDCRMFGRNLTQVNFSRNSADSV